MYIGVGVTEKWVQLEGSPQPVGIYRGHVVDQDNAMLEGVTVNIGGLYSMITDSAGYYNFENIPVGDYVITYSKPGYTTITTAP